MSKRLLNTTCEALFKDGTTKQFNSIEEASENTGISISSIKIRCNKPDTKSYPKFKWLDSKTAAHYRARKSKNKGSALEYQVRDDLKELGYDVVTSRSESKTRDAGKQDVIAVDDSLPFSCQVKCTQVLPNYFKMRDDCIDQKKPFVTIWKKQTDDGSVSPGTVAVIPYSFFLELLKFYKQ